MFEKIKLTVKDAECDAYQAECNGHVIQVVPARVLAVGGRGEVQSLNVRIYSDTTETVEALEPALAKVGNEICRRRVHSRITECWVLYPGTQEEFLSAYENALSALDKNLPSAAWEVMAADVADELGRKRYRETDDAYAALGRV